MADQGARRDATVGAVGVFLAVTALILIPGQIPGQTLRAITDPTTAGFFPALAAMTLFFCCALLVISAMLREPTVEQDPEPLVTGRYLATGALLTGYLVAIHLVGMFIATAVMIVGLSLCFGYRNWAAIAASAFIMPVLIWALFEKVLVIVFPTGALF